MATLLLSPGIQQYWSIIGKYYPPDLQAEWNDLIARYSDNASFAEMWDKFNQ